MGRGKDMKKTIGIFSTLSTLLVWMTGKLETPNPFGLSPGDMERGDY